jgi:predicted CXXCH cytochrome family protein
MKARHPIRRPRAVLALLAWVLAGVLSQSGTGAAENLNSIVFSKHNLSASGPGEVRSGTEGEICIFCHAPHTPLTQAPLWNHQMPVTAYNPYSSVTLKAKVGQPTGASRLCLSCHDGTVALGLVGNRTTPIPMRKGATTMPPGGSRLGTDLTGHHPISFTYDSALAVTRGELRDPMTLQGQVRVDAGRQVQCTSCHDPHSDRYGKFLVRDNTASALCIECHTLNEWNSSVHATSPAGWNGTGRNPWPNSKGKTVAANGCENCHTPHAAGVKRHLLKFPKAEDNCLVCHNGSVAAKNVASEFSKQSAHPLIGLPSLRDSAQGLMNTTEQHLACTDCHNPHTVRKSSLTEGSARTALGQVKGVTAAGAVVNTAAHEYELCFRCHASSKAFGIRKVARQFVQPDTRLQFNPVNASYHPVLSVSKSASSRSLIPPWTAARQMVCSDCHNNDQGPGANGTGANGPHGSRFSPLLERNLVQVDFQAESASAYALCYKCHSESVLMSDPLHGKHVRDQRTSCSTCHDAHGVQTQAHLINFNTLYVTPFNGRIGYLDRGFGRSSCTLVCHGSNHNNKSY